MLKNFKLIISVILVTASSFGAVAQTETYKDVILDGKPAKLNVITGEVTNSDGAVVKSLAARKIKDSVKASNTVIKKNPITFESKLDSIKTAQEVKLTQTNASNTVKSTPENVIYTNEPDTLVNHFKNNKVIVSSDSDKVMATQTVFITTNSSNIDTIEAKGATNISENEPLKIKEKATSMVYEVSKPATNDDNTTNFHKVLKGETLYILSQRYHTSLGVLKKANNLETTLIRVGQILRIKNFDTYSYGQISNDWTVSKGDTLYNIAHRNNTTVASLKSLNGLTSNLIKIGQKLQLK